jgi:hypothetical protein
LGCLTLELKALQVWSLKKCLPKHTAVFGPEENTLQSIETSRKFYPLTQCHLPKGLKISKHVTTTSNPSKIRITKIRQHKSNAPVQSSASIKETQS